MQLTQERRQAAQHWIDQHSKPCSACGKGMVITDADGSWVHRAGGRAEVAFHGHCACEVPPHLVVVPAVVVGMGT